MREFLSWIREEESGQGMVEYGIIVALVVIIAVAVFAKGGNLDDGISGIFDKIATKLNSITIS